MALEPAVGLTVSVVTVSFVFLVLPLVITLVNLRAVWEANRANGILMVGIVGLTGLLFIFYIVGVLEIFATGS